MDTWIQIYLSPTNQEANKNFFFSTSGSPCSLGLRVGGCPINEVKSVELRAMSGHSGNSSFSDRLPSSCALC